ncbi:hypothetical protein [Mycoplasmoides alvi]|uniref:hypothetical protein n=1 Tax=Mycoplasmoides alvi TaxID=78580 RepID=UPI00051B53CD|nr:hypothetical protein [Mycoplasmoides alvi]
MNTDFYDDLNSTDSKFNSDTKNINKSIKLTSLNKFEDNNLLNDDAKLLFSAHENTNNVITEKNKNASTNLNTLFSKKNNFQLTNSSQEPTEHIFVDRKNSQQEYLFTKENISSNLTSGQIPQKEISLKTKDNLISNNLNALSNFSSSENEKKIINDKVNIPINVNEILNNIDQITEKDLSNKLHNNTSNFFYTNILNSSKLNKNSNNVGDFLSKKNNTNNQMNLDVNENLPNNIPSTKNKKSKNKLSSINLKYLLIFLGWLIIVILLIANLAIK